MNKDKIANSDLLHLKAKQEKNMEKRKKWAVAWIFEF